VNQRGRNKRGFTLIELLVVVAIIMLLAAMLFPAYQYAREVARKTKAKSEVKQLEVAFKAIQSDFRVWSQVGISGIPDVDGRDVDFEVVQFLQGGNSRGVIYMEFDGSSTNSAGKFVDPWYDATRAPNDNNIYQVALGSQGYITPYSGSQVYREIGAWSRGKDGSDTGAAAQKDNVTSW